MPIEIRWDEASRNTAHVRYIMPWDWNEYYRAIAALTTMAAELELRLNVIADFTLTPRLPSGALTHFNMTSQDSETRGIVVVVGANRFIRVIGNALLKINPIGTRNLYFAQTVDEARQILEKAAPV